MDPLGQTGTPLGADLTAALDRLWVRFLPEIEQRLAVLESAAAASATKTLAPEQREAAHAAAHKLAGVLGSFGLGDGTSLARESELLYDSQPAPNPSQAQRLARLAAGLRALIDARKQTQTLPQ